MSAGTVSPMTLTDFLLARIAEDAIEAGEMGEVEYYEGGWRDEYVARVLAECAAKRAIVELHGRAHECSTYRHDEVDNCTWCLDAEDCSTLLALASVYADHDDFDPRWA